MRQVARRSIISIDSYRPTYRVSPYRRPLLQRLTPLAWFVVALAVIGLLGGGAVLVYRASEARNGTELLADRLSGRTGATTAQASRPTALPPSAAQSAAQSHGSGNVLAKRAVTAVPTVMPTAAPTAMPTADPNRVAWADQLEPQRDGTLLAPQAVVDKAVADLSAYYVLQRDLPLADYLARRDEILATYFSGPALEAMREQEAQRKQYPMNRGGQFTLQVRDFAPDGKTAKAGVILRGWTNDIYDVATKRVRAKGQIDQDMFAIITIRFDQANGRWTFDAVEEVAELEP